MRPLFRILSFFTLLSLFVLLPGNVNSCYAGVPVFNDITKWKAAPASSHTPKPASPSVATRTTTPQGGSPVVLGTSHSISQVKKRKGPVVTAATTKRLNRKISSRAAIIIDAKTGKTLYSRNPDSRRQPASTIKVLTGMIALKSLSKTEQVAISRKAARQPRSKIYLDQKKHYKATDLINAVLLASANDASVALAEWIAGDEKSFAKMMTLRAQLWGANNTVCKTATGLTAKGQKSTARDLATIFRHAMNDPDFSSRMKTIKTRTSGGKLLRNHNKALWQVKGALGGKTGYTNAARQTYVGKFKRGKNEIIVAIMGSETMWSDIKRLVTYGFKLKIAESENAKSADEPIQIIADTHDSFRRQYASAKP
jgi:D-alanyl-D-alanine carboxypeptidase (penicillin-binding protein 5/6)